MTLSNSTGAASSGLHGRHEKSGLIFDSSPIPWNADAVIVEANVKVPAGAPQDKSQFTLVLAPDGAPIPAELIGNRASEQTTRIFFRIPVPAQDSTVEVRWRDHSLGQVELPWDPLESTCRHASLSIL